MKPLCHVLIKKIVHNVNRYMNWNYPCARCTSWNFIIVWLWIIHLSKKLNHSSNSGNFDKPCDRKLSEFKEWCNISLCRMNHTHKIMVVEFHGLHLAQGSWHSGYKINLSILYILSPSLGHTKIFYIPSWFWGKNKPYTRLFFGSTGFWNIWPIMQYCQAERSD